MRFYRFSTVVALVAFGCAQQQQLDDEPTDDTPSDGDGGSIAGKASTGGSVGKAGTSSTAGKAADMAGGSSGGKGGGGGSGAMEEDGGETGSGGTPAQGGKATGGTGGKATGGTGGKATGGTGGKAAGGSGGSAGTGGSSAGTGGGGTGGAGCKPSTGGPVAGLSARYQSEINGTTGTSVGSQLSIYNTSANTFNLTDLRIRYYLTNEVAATINKNINWAWLRPIAGGQTDIKPKVIFNVVDMTCTAAKADTYFEFTFTADAGLLSPNQYVLLSWTANNGATQSFDQSNDYSFSAGQVIGSDYNNVVVLQNSGTKLWGTEP